MVDRGGIDFSLETAACKVFGSELAFRASNDALQIAGGIGYSKEYPYEQAVRDSRINLIFEGTNEILRALIALMGLQQPGERLKALGKAFKDPIHSLGAIGYYVAGRAKRQITKPEFTQVHPALERRSGAVGDAGARPRARRRRRDSARTARRSSTEQFLQERMANAAIDIFMAAAVLSRTTWEIERAGSEEAAKAQLDCARDLRADGVSPRAAQHPRRCASNQDARLKAIATRSLDTGDSGARSAYRHLTPRRPSLRKAMM